MVTVNSISGGKTSAYMAYAYPADYNTFCLVRVEDQDCRFKDEKVRRWVEDRIQTDFIGTVEDDMIIYTIMDLEQYLGKKITWLTGMTYEEVIRTKGGWLPNVLHRYCTTWLKMDPQFKFWYKNFFPEAVEMRIGFRGNETKRAESVMSKLNENGLLEYKATVSKHKNGRNKWQEFAWQKPRFPLIENFTLKDQITNFWGNRPVRFAAYNNCVGCFHRNPLFLNKMYQLHPNKIEWFAKQENLKTNRIRDHLNRWRTDTTYEKIKNFKPRLELSFEDFGSCDTQGCTD
jgi:hypothetical protein